MNIRKNIDYSAMFAALDAVLNAELPQMELCCELWAASSVPSRRKARQWPQPNICTAVSPMLPASPRGTFAGCVSSIGCMRTPPNC